MNVVITVALGIAVLGSLVSFKEAMNEGNGLKFLLNIPLFALFVLSISFVWVR